MAGNEHHQPKRIYNRVSRIHLQTECIWLSIPFNRNVSECSLLENKRNYVQLQPNTVNKIQRHLPTSHAPVNSHSGRHAWTRRVNNSCSQCRLVHIRISYKGWRDVATTPFWRIVKTITSDYILKLMYSNPEVLPKAVAVTKNKGGKNQSLHYRKKYWFYSVETVTKLHRIFALSRKYHLIWSRLYENLHPSSVISNWSN